MPTLVAAQLTRTLAVVVPSVVGLTILAIGKEPVGVALLITMTTVAEFVRDWLSTIVYRNELVPEAKPVGS